MNKIKFEPIDDEEVIINIRCSKRESTVENARREMKQGMHDLRNDTNLKPRKMSLLEKGAFFLLESQLANLEESAAKGQKRITYLIPHVLPVTLIR
jgi:hypothetical protein